MKKRFLAFAFFVLLGACATRPPAHDSVSSPASPHAPESNRLHARQTHASNETSRKIDARLKETATRDGQLAHHDVKGVTHSKNDDSTHKPTGNETAAMYGCPMHPEVRQNQPGKCAICGMTLIEKEKSEHR